MGGLCTFYLVDQGDVHGNNFAACQLCAPKCCQTHQCKVVPQNVSPSSLYLCCALYIHRAMHSECQLCGAHGKKFTPGNNFSPSGAKYFPACTRMCKEVSRKKVHARKFFITTPDCIAMQQKTTEGRRHSEKDEEHFLKVAKCNLFENR